MYRLDARRVVDMGHRGDLRTRHVELFDAEEALLLFRHCDTARRLHSGDEQHVGTVLVDLEPVRHVLS